MQKKKIVSIKGGDNYKPMPSLDDMQLAPQDYADANAGIILLGIDLCIKNRKGQDTDVLLPDPVQVQYINMRTAGMTQKEACTKLQIDRAMPMLWEEAGAKDSVYVQCVRIIKRIEAEDLESVVWRRATTVASASLERMFALKSRMSEYKDNAPAAAFRPQVRITIGGKNYDVSANLQMKAEVVNGQDDPMQDDQEIKDVTDDSEETRFDTYIGDGT